MAKKLVKISFREDGDANFYTIIANGNWLMSIHHNGEDTLEKQREHMRLLCTALEKNYNG